MFVQEVIAMKEILIGTWAWGTGYNGSSMIFGKKQDESVLRETFNMAVNEGFLKWDTAAVYGMGSCERLLGELMKGRDNIFISTKFFPDKKYKEGALVKSFNESMTNLGRSSADLFWIHVPNNLTENLKETVPLLKAGRIKNIGISNVSLEHVKLAEKVLAEDDLKLGAVQNHFSLLRNDQQHIIDYCNGRGIKYCAYMVLEQGALSGNYSAKHHFPLLSMRNLMFPKSKFKKIEGLLGIMKQTADKYGIDPSQVPILWTVSKGAVPIVGVTKPSHVKKLAEAMNVSLTEEDVSLIEKEAATTSIRQQGSWEPQ